MVSVTSANQQNDFPVFVDVSVCGTSESEPQLYVKLSDVLSNLFVQGGGTLNYRNKLNEIARISWKSGVVERALANMDELRRSSMNFDVAGQMS